MRVISGSARGKKLIAPDGMNTRPTQDRVKESVFNIIRNYVLDAKVLDLFAGTGNLSIEALSRGASMAYLVEKSKDVCKIIAKNLEGTRLNDKAEVLNCYVNGAISKMKDDNILFDIIFMDPPYNTGLVNETLKSLDDKCILKQDGIIIVERHKDDFIDYEQLTNIELLKEKKYGDTYMSFLGGKREKNDSSLSR